MNNFEVRRTGYCGQFNKNFLNQQATVMGWVANIRIVGKKLAFIDLKDREGIIQLVFTKEKMENELLHKITIQSVIWATGEVVERKKTNPDLKTGEIELKVKDFGIFSLAKELPFALHGFIEVDEEILHKYRYLALRMDNELEKSVKLRHRSQLAIFKSMDRMGFYHIETPILLKSTPEGARDFLVPSRLHKGKFYALPQSPQILKQLTMVAGVDKYFQFAKCFRDEDLRSDRQPEFTQIDIEMSFVNQEEIFSMAEQLMQDLFKEVLAIELQTPFSRISFQTAKSIYGSDKPDLRIKSSYEPLSLQIGKKFGIKVRKGEKIKQLDASGLQYDEIQGFINESGINMEEVVIIPRKDSQEAESEDMFVIVTKTDSQGYLSEQHELLRRFISTKSNNLSKQEFNFTWITDFPLFEWSDTDQAITPSHHPFTSPHPEDAQLFDKEPLKVRAYAYDLVLNGFEIGGGSIRIHDSALQSKIFDVLGIDKKEASQRFGFLLEAFTYGTPPHGGMAFGFDRLLMIMAGESSIKEVITFPKTRIATDLLTGAPDSVKKEQLDELGLKLLNL